MSLQGGKFANLSDGTSDIVLNNYVPRAAISATDFIEEYSMSIAQGISNQVAKRGSTTTGNTLSEFQGPRGSVTSMTFMPSLEINAEGSSTPSYYTLYGRAAQTAASLGLGTAGSNTYDVIDTTIYVRGLASGTQLQVPLRLIRLKS